MQKTREEIPEEFKWDLSKLFVSDEAWQKDFDSLKSCVDRINELQGKLDHSAENLAEVIKRRDELSRVKDRVRTYASCNSDQDTGNAKYLAMVDKIDTESAKLLAAVSWIEPEVFAMGEEKTAQFCKAPVMAPYLRYIEVLLRDKPHTLSKSEEALIAGAEDALSTASNVYKVLANADLKFPVVKNDKGEDQEITQSNYVTLLMSKNRDLRREVFTSYFKVHEGMRNTLAMCLSGNVKMQVYKAHIRHFKSALCASLHNDNVGQEVYDSLIEAVHESLPAFFEYVTLRRKCLGLEYLDMYDNYVPIVPNFHLEVPYSQGREWVLEALRPLGDEYCAVVKRAFTERWIDVYENKGKQSGAYSGGCYDSPPFILSNYTGTLDSVFTLAHEMGHSMHTHLSKSHQTHLYSEYRIFVAEVASTVNEALLFHYLVNKTTDEKFIAYLLNQKCDDFKSTVFRQTMFAEFEKVPFLLRDVTVTSSAAHPRARRTRRSTHR
eukprot:TRINITY_DN2031_c0_g1_i3.p1 TRINITY_DN2031_c0_g1~~TRINITY_DN2031_c0_g1_i3.p1  ORF type:complete len:505 (-),score=167.75 TRINITY_DN2031_c0_g1_i3:430-1908(-)